MGRPEADQARCLAMTELGNGLCRADHQEDALSVQEAHLSLMRRHGELEHNLLIVQGNLALTYKALGRLEPALPINRDVFLGFLKLYGEEHSETLREANNYAALLLRLERHGDASKLLRKLTPVARRFLGESDETTLKMRWGYAEALYVNIGATLDDLRESVETLEDTLRIARRTLGGAHPVTVEVEGELKLSRAALRARETPPTSA